MTCSGNCRAQEPEIAGDVAGASARAGDIRCAAVAPTFACTVGARYRRAAAREDTRRCRGRARRRRGRAAPESVAARARGYAAAGIHTSWDSGRAVRRQSSRITVSTQP